MTDEVRELNADEIETVNGGAQYPIGWPDGLPMPRPSGCLYGRVRSYITNARTMGLPRSASFAAVLHFQVGCDVGSSGPVMISRRDSRAAATRDEKLARPTGIEPVFPP